MTSGPKDPLSPDPDRDVTLDAAALRVLAHPIRLNLLNRLREYGPSTARTLAKEFDLDTGAASYHLRRLAAGGLIEEDQDRGNRRDRWWRAHHRSSHHDPATVEPSERQDSRSYTNAVLLFYSDRLRRLASAVPLYPADWFEASIFSNYTLRLTPGELNELKSELVDVIARYRARDPDAAAAAAAAAAADADADGAEQVSVQLQMFPLL